MNTDSTQLQVFGKTMKTMLPSGRVFTIREQNGNDDDVLSNPMTKSDLTNIDNFLNGICITETVDNVEVAVTLKTITELPNNDRYHLLIQSRVFSLGNIMTFTFDWGEEGGNITYEEDLKQYLHDYSKVYPNKGDEGYFEYKIPPYPANANIDSRYEFTITGGKKFRFGLMTRQGEKLAINLPHEQLTKNLELKLRNLEYYDESQGFVKVENFSQFTSRDMQQIKKCVLEIDPTYLFVTTLKNPKTNETIKYPLMNSTDFFFPVEI